MTAPADVIDEDDTRLSEPIAVSCPQRIQLDGFDRSIMGSIMPISTLEAGSKHAQNVRTSPSISERARRLVPHGFQPDRTDHAGRMPSYGVKGNIKIHTSGEKGEVELLTASPAPHTSTSCAARKRGPGRSKYPGKRGPKGSTYLTWDQVKEIDGFTHLCRSAGKPLNRMVTIRAPIGVPDGTGKRAIQQIVAHIRQDFKRAELIFVGVIVYEKDQHLHAHVLLHVPSGKGELIDKRHQGEDGDVHVRPADDKGVEYVTKQREWLGRYEPVIRRKRVKCARIEGPRYSYTTSAKAILAEAERRRAPPPPSTEIRVKPTVVEEAIVASAATEQLSMFDELPQVRADEDLPAIIRDRRQESGVTQTDFAALLGIRRPHLANVERFHDRLSPARRRAARYHLERLAA